MTTRAAVAFVVLACACGCAEPLEFADWTIPVPEGARVIEYAAVPIEDRTERIELTEDLVIGGEPGTSHSFYDPQDVAVDRRGQIYVLDGGNHRVQVFDHKGNYVRTLGREGQGPGEIGGGRAVVVTGGRLAVWDHTNRRLSFWNLEGDHLGESRLSSNQTPNKLFGTYDETLIMRHQRTHDDLSMHERFVRVSVEGEELREYVELPVTNRISFKPSADLGSQATAQSILRGWSAVASLGSAVPTVAVAPEGVLYLTASYEHQILAVDIEAQVIWALRAQSVRRPFPEAEVDRLAAALPAVVPGLGKSSLQWPDWTPAIEHIHVDGHGHLYVFHYVYVPVGSSIDSRPVDVYSREGERLFSGMIAERPWSEVSGDYVYSIAEDSQSEEKVVIRYRLVEPFE